LADKRAHRLPRVELFQSLLGKGSDSVGVRHLSKPRTAGRRRTARYCARPAINASSAATPEAPCRPSTTAV
jgi:hypothetical protein